MNYAHQRILEEQDIATLKDYVATIEWDIVFQDYNLFNLKRHDCKTSEISEPYSKLAEYANGRGMRNGFGTYFLKYEEGSFARMHKDNESKLTIVTLIETSEDLVGGDAVVLDEYKSPVGGRNSTHKCNRSGPEKERPPYGQNIITDVIPVQDGESLIYGNDLDHAVSRVHSGQRTVLITWFR